MSKTKGSSNLSLRAKKLGEQLDWIDNNLRERLFHLNEEKKFLDDKVVPPITKQLFKRKTKYFKLLIMVGTIILILASIMTITGFAYTLQVKNVVLNFNSDTWNQLFYFGLAIFSIACIFFEIRESNDDQLHLCLAEDIMRRSGEIYAERAVINKKLAENTKVINKIKKLKSIIEKHN